MGYTKKLFKKSILGVYATRVLKGCLFLLTILVTVADHEMTNLHLITYILLAFTAVTIIDIYCQVIGDQIRTREPMTFDGVRRVSADFLPQMVPGLAGAILFAMSWTRAITQDMAFRITEIGCTALMVLFCYASQRLTGRKRWQAARAGFIAALVGAGFVLLRSSLS